MSDKWNSFARDREVFGKGQDENFLEIWTFFLIQVRIQQFIGLAQFKGDSESQETIQDFLEEMRRLPSIAADVLNQPEMKKDMNYMAEKFAHLDTKQKKSK